jgi:hypothetical protein
MGDTAEKAAGSGKVWQRCIVATGRAVAKEETLPAISLLPYSVAINSAPTKKESGFRRVRIHAHLNRDKENNPGRVLVRISQSARIVAAQFIAR